MIFKSQKWISGTTTDNLKSLAFSLMPIMIAFWDIFLRIFFSYFQVEAMQQAGGEQAQQAQEMLKDQVNNFFSVKPK